MAARSWAVRPPSAASHCACVLGSGQTTLPITAMAGVCWGQTSFLEGCTRAGALYLWSPVSSPGLPSGLSSLGMCSQPSSSTPPQLCWPSPPWNVGCRPMLQTALCPLPSRVQSGFSLKLFQRQQLHEFQGFSNNPCSLGSVLRSEGSTHSLLQGPESPTLLLNSSFPHIPQAWAACPCPVRHLSASLWLCMYTGSHQGQVGSP